MLAVVAVVIGLSGVAQAGLIANWAFNEGSGAATAIDAMGNYNGTVDTSSAIKPTTGDTAGKIGVGPESSVGSSFKGAGKEVGKGGMEVGHEMKQGKPLAAGKEMGKAMGRAGKKVGEGVKKAVTTDSDRGDREKKP